MKSALQASLGCGAGAATLGSSKQAPAVGGTASRPALARQRSVPLRPPRRLDVAAAAAAAAPQADKEEDLWQFADRDQWYLAKFCATDQPDWHPARFLRSTQLAPGVREVVLECEVSRERVPLRNAYKHVGQAASVRVNSGAPAAVPPAAPPFPQALNRDALLRVRGDMVANETKTVKEELSVVAELPLYVREERYPELYRLAPDDIVEVGPFSGGGLQLRGPIAAVFRFPTVVLFCEGEGIAAAAALIEAGTDPCGLSLTRRQDVRMYYRAPNEAALCYRERYEEWARRYNVHVVTSTRDSFSDMFDDDETLMYEPDSTAAVLLCGGDAEAEAAAAAAAAEAEIGVVVRQSEEAEPTNYLVYGKPKE